MGKQSRLRQEKRARLIQELETKRKEVQVKQQTRMFERVRGYYKIDTVIPSVILCDNVFIYCRNLVEDAYESAENRGVDTLSDWFDDTAYWEDRINSIRPPFNPTFLEFVDTDHETIVGVLIEVAWGESDSYRYTARFFEWRDYNNLLEIPGSTPELVREFTGRDPFEPEATNILHFQTDSSGILLAEISIEDGDLKVPTVLMALRFMNCRNVEMVERQPSEYAASKIERTFGHKPISYKVLKINPVSKRSDELDDQPANTSFKSLHIVRGHFATYSDTLPLFGKYVGTFWIPDHVRGNEKRGVVVKDYKVIAPEAE